MRFTCLDFETTGAVKGFPNEPWQLGLVDVEDGRVLPGTMLETRLRVAADRPFSPRAPGRWAQIRAELAAAPTMADLWPELAPRLAGRPLVAHNAGTERTVLEHAAPLTAFGPWVDTLKLARAAYPGLPSHALGDLAEAFGIVADANALCPGRTWHDALYDACACALLACRFANDGLFAESPA